MRRKLFKFVAFAAFCLFVASTVFGAGTKYTGFQAKVSGSGQPVILIPGATCSGDEWKETVQHLGNKYQCHVLTLAGYAGTPALPSGPYLAQIKDQIKQYIQDNKLTDVILIGHSIGGYLSLCLASEMNSGLQKVIVVDAMPFFAGVSNPNAPDTFSEEKAKSMYAYYQTLSEKDMKAGQLKAAMFLCRDSTHWETIAEWGATSDRKTFAYTLTEMMSTDMRKKIGDIRVPVLVLAAWNYDAAHPGFTREYVTTMYDQQYKACSACTVHTAEKNAKHFIMYDAPEWYFSETDAFLKK